ncbi:MAG: agmatinase [Hyphomicrobiales bacterium]|nr:agmatinase [Hyphomicrobiales bacterium]
MRGMPPTFAIPPSFLGITRQECSAAFCIAGVPFDLGTTGRAGARDGPRAIRAASRMLVDGQNPRGWKDVFRLDLADVGDLEIVPGDVPGSLARIGEQAAVFRHLIALGGDHTITLALLRAAARRHGEPLGLVHFDAHVDTWPDAPGAAPNHGSVFRHAVEEGLVDPRRLVQIGIRSPVPRDVHQWIVGRGARVVTAEDVHLSTPDLVAAAVRDTVGAGPAYLSFDIDALDPSQAPGTGTPEVGGLFTWQAMGILARLQGIDFVGMDLVEVCPAFDTAEITALAGASLVWQYLGLHA